MTADVTATLEFLCPTPERPYTYMYSPADGRPLQNAAYQRLPVTIRDARAAAPSIEREGFVLHHAPSAVGDFTDRDEVVRRYYPEAAELALAVCGASQAIVFDHLVRQRMPGPPHEHYACRARSVPDPVGAEPANPGAGVGARLRAAGARASLDRIHQRGPAPVSKRRPETYAAGLATGTRPAADAGGA